MWLLCAPRGKQGHLGRIELHALGEQQVGRQHPQVIIVSDGPHPELALRIGGLVGAFGAVGVDQRPFLGREAAGLLNESGRAGESGMKAHHPRQQPTGLTTLLDEEQVLAQPQLPIVPADALGCLEGEDCPQPARPHHPGLGGQATRQAVWSLEAVIEGGGAAVQHLEAAIVGGRADHLVVEPVLDQRPPEIREERPEAGWRLGQRYAVREHAVKVGVAVDETRRQHLPACTPNLVFRVSCQQRRVRGAGRDLASQNAHAPARPGWLPRLIDHEVR